MRVEFLAIWLVCPECWWESVFGVVVEGIGDLWWWEGVVPAEWRCPVGGAVGVAGVAEAAAVFGSVVVQAFRIEAAVAGASAGGLSRSEWFDVVDLAAFRWSEAAGGAAGAISGDDELFEGFWWLVSSAAVVQDDPRGGVVQQSLQGAVGDDGSGLIGGDGAVAGEFARVVDA